MCEHWTQEQTDKIESEGANLAVAHDRAAEKLQEFMDSPNKTIPVLMKYLDVMTSRFRAECGHTSAAMFIGQLSQQEAEDDIDGHFMRAMIMAYFTGHEMGRAGIDLTVTKACPQTVNQD